MTQAYVYKWTHIPTMKYYVGSRTAKNCHPDDGYICSSRVVKPLIVEHPSEWVRTIVEVGTPEEMYQLETEILETFDCKNDPRSFNRHNNDGLRCGLPGDKNGAWKMKRPDLSERNRNNKGKPNYGVRGPRPNQMGENNVMKREDVKKHHQEQIIKAVNMPDIKKKHAEACKIAQNKPEVKAATSARMKISQNTPEAKQRKSKLVSGDNNPSRKYRLTCPKCNRTMSKAMYMRWGHGDQCVK